MVTPIASLRFIDDCILILQLSCNFTISTFLFKMAVRVANCKGKFHTRCGTNVQLSPDRERADKRDIIRIFDDFVCSSASLIDQLFQIKYEGGTRSYAQVSMHHSISQYEISTLRDLLS